MEEIWKDIEGYEGYYKISNFGKVKSLDRYVKHTENVYQHIEERLLSPHLDDKGYFVVTLSKDGIAKHHLLHRLVAQAFIPNPNNLPFINHKDENPKNNHVENLEWCTPEYNVNYGSSIQRRAEMRKIPVTQFDLEGNFIKNWDCISRAAHECGTIRASSNIIKFACINRTVVYGSFWRYTLPEYKEGYKLDESQLRNKNDHGYGNLVIVKDSMTGNIIKKYYSVRQASKDLSVDPSTIFKKAKSQESHKGYIFQVEQRKTHILDIIDQSNLERDLNQRQVFKIRISDYKIMGQYLSIIAAEKVYGKYRKDDTRYYILANCQGKIPVVGRWIWKFVDEYEEVK